MSGRRLISSGSPFEADYGYSRAVAQGGFVVVAGLLRPEMRVEIEVTAMRP